MNFLKRQIFVLLVLCGILPSQGMLSPKTLQRLNQWKYLQRFKTNKPVNIPEPTNKPIKTPQVNFPQASWGNWNPFTSLKNTFSDWYTNLGTTIQTAKNRLNLAIRSKKHNAQIFDIDKKYAETGTYKHFKKYRTNIIRNYPGIFSDYFFTSMIQAAIKKEKELNDLGYETFYHGRWWKYQLISDIYGRFFEYKSGKKLDDFIFTHLDDPVLGKINPQFFASEKAKRERILENWFKYASSSLLYLNKFLFGNINLGGSCTILYLSSNTNIKQKDFSIEEIFAMFGYSNIYRMYEKKLQELEQEHNTLSKFGELLLIGIPKNKINKCVVPITIGTYNKIPSIGKPTDTEQSLNYLNKNPEDRSEFALIETRDEDGGLNPDSGIKVFSFNTVDPDKMAAFKEKENALFARIMQSLKQEETIKQEKEQKQKTHQQVRE